MFRSDDVLTNFYYYTCSPRYPRDVIEPVLTSEKDGLRYTFDVPGSTASDVEATLSKNRLTLNVRNRGRKLESTWECPKGYSFDDVKVTCGNGVLEVFAPRNLSTPLEVRKIEVSSG